MVIRALRVARLFKVFKFFRPLKGLLDTLVTSFPSFAAIMILTILFWVRGVGRAGERTTSLLPSVNCVRPRTQAISPFLCLLPLTISISLLCPKQVVFAIMGLSVFGGLPLDLSYLVFPAYPNFNTFLSSLLITFQVWALCVEHVQSCVDEKGLGLLPPFALTKRSSLGLWKSRGREKG